VPPVPAEASGPLLARGFFARPAPEVAPELLGCVLRHATTAGAVAVVITEVEAYAGAADAASHAFRGLTARNAVMFGEPGHAYVYFTYGMHFCVNLVCLPEGTASAVLLRAGRVIEGAGLAAARRPAAARASAAAAQRDLARGPARLCRALAIDRSLDGADVCDPASPLRVLGRAADVPAVGRGPRVGVSRAAAIPWRFWIDAEPTVSAYRAYAPRRRAVKAVSVPAPEGGTMHR
jgi:DNA-3-methyladenine glycosylase